MRNAEKGHPSLIHRTYCKTKVTVRRVSQLVSNRDWRFGRCTFLAHPSSPSTLLRINPNGVYPEPCEGLKKAHLPAPLVVLTGFEKTRRACAYRARPAFAMSSLFLMEYQATAKYVRTSPRKLRLVADAVRKLSPKEAIARLTQSPKHAAVALREAIASALANAKAKEGNMETLEFKRIEVMGGPVMKRWHAVSRGQAHSYKKRMAHIRVVLTDEARNPKS